MVKIQLQRKTLYCCFVDFKKAFDTIPGSELGKRMIEIRMSLVYRAVVAQLHKQVRCQLEMEEFLEKHGGQVRVSTFTHTLWSMC